MVPAGRALWKPHPDHHRGEQEERLAEHAGLGLDASDPPAEDTDTVDHGGVGVGSDQGVGQGGADAVDLPHGHRLGQVLQVDLVDDAHPRRHHAETVERLLGPAEQGVALVVALVLALDVASVGVGAAEGVDLHGVVDDQVDRDQRVDATGVAPATLHGAPHRGQVDDRGDAGEVLEQHTGRHEGPLPIALDGPAVPAREGGHVVVGDEALTGVAKQVLEQDPHGHRQPRHVSHAALRERVHPVVGDSAGELRAGPEAILRHGHLTSTQAAAGEHRPTRRGRPGSRSGHRAPRQVII